MNRLRRILSFTGIALVIVSLALDQSLGRPELGRIVAWAAIGVLIVAVVMRVVEKRGK